MGEVGENELLSRAAEIKFKVLAQASFFFFLARMVRVSREGRIAKCIAFLLPSLSYTLSKLA